MLDMGLGAGLVLIYWFGAALSIVGLGAVTWMVGRSILMTWLVMLGWLGVSVWLFGVYRLILKTGDFV